MRIEHRAGVIQEYIGRTRWQGVLWPHVVQVFVQPLQGPLTDRHKPVFLAFALPDRQHAGSGIHILLSQINDFLSSDAGGVQHFQNGPVSYALIGVDVG